jgi:hypothetical protein
MIRIILAWAATAIIVACGGGSGGGGGSASLRNACTKICDCFEGMSSFSNSGGNCVDDCVNSESLSGSTSGSDVPQACLNCINAATCDGLTSGEACSVECNF